MADQKSENPLKNPKKNVSTRSLRKKNKDAKSKKCDVNVSTRGKAGDKDKKKKKKLGLFSFLNKDAPKEKEMKTAAKTNPTSKADKSMLKREASADSDVPSKANFKEAPSTAPSKFEKEAKVAELSPEAEQSALAFLKHLEGLTPEQCTTEYAQVTGVTPSTFSPEGTQLTSNDPKIPCIEETRVKVENVTQSFYHANKLSFEKDNDREWIIAQPPKDNAEAFWRLVFQEQAPMVVVLGAAFEGGKKQYDEFFPEKKDEYKYYGTMSLNNKKVDTDGGMTIITFEVLPEGCSNSLMMKLVWAVGWEKGDMNQGPTCAKILSQMIKLEPGPIVSVSASGTGRSCVVAAASLLSARVCAGTYTNVVDLAVGMRKQRANALPDKVHYASIYSMIGNYVTTRMKDKSKWETAMTRYKDTVAPGVKKE